MNTTRLRLSLLPIALLGCSASSSSGEPFAPAKADSGASPVADAGGPAAPDDAPAAALKDPAECAGSAACVTCCVTDFSGGAQLYGIVAEQCVCEGAGSCAGVCSPGDCAAIGSKDPACQACLNERMSATCQPKADAVCAADATCKVYARCLAGCH